MNSIIHYLLIQNQYLLQIIFFLFNFICKFIPLRQLVFDDSNSPDYQKFKTDKLPVIKTFEKLDYEFLIEYYKWRYNKTIKPIKRRGEKEIPSSVICPRCGAPHDYIYDNNGNKGAYLCKVCNQAFGSIANVTKPLILTCPYCGRSLTPVKSRKHFTVHKCVNTKCSYYLQNLKKVKKQDLDDPYGKNKYKLHYIYREFNIDFFKIDIDSLPKNASSLKFRKQSAHIMGLCLTYHVNLGLSLRKTAQALHDIHNINISHTMVANYAKTAALLVKPFVDNFDYPKSDTFVADETYIKVKGVKGYLWLIMDAVSRSIIGYKVSDNRGVGACIMAMRMAFKNITELPKTFKFIADGYPAYPLAAQQFALNKDNPLEFEITQVIGLTNDDAVSKEFRPFKQMIERLNRTFKASYRCTCGYDNFDGSDYAAALWVCYYNFLRPHQFNNYQVLNRVEILDGADTMQGKWQLIIFLGQQTILNMQSKSERT
ncbi:MAG: DDE-type integrase/transposase/recombinase [Alphaproteobacteria bacterium]|nr:DDE-type integrase/transposase/recombinase [Alphaproteobacteria bacterium]